MSTHADTIREALEREIESHGDRLHNCTSPSKAQDLKARRDKCREALAALAELSKDEAPPAAPLIDARSWYIAYHDLHDLASDGMAAADEDAVAMLDAFGAEIQRSAAPLSSRAIKLACDRIDSVIIDAMKKAVTVNGDLNSIDRSSYRNAVWNCIEQSMKDAALSEEDRTNTETT